MANKEINILEDKKVIVKPIVKPSGFFKKGHDGEFMYTRCKERFSIPYDGKVNGFAKIFGDNPTEARAIQKLFEKELSKKEGDLNLYDRKNPFWGKFFVELDKNEITLDLNNPVQALQYRVLLSRRDIIAPSWGQRFDRPSYKWALCDPDIVEKEVNKKGELIAEAIKLFTAIQNSENKMSNVLRLMGKKIPKNSSKDWLKTEITKTFTQIEKIAGTSSIKDFIEAASDPKIDDKIFVFDAVEAEFIVIEDGIFKDTESKALLGKSLEAVVNYYNNGENQDDKLLMKQKLDRS